jgi:hypothetical protein
MCSQTLLVYYIEERLDFNDRDIASMFLMIGIFGILVQGFVLKFINDWLGERRVVMVAYTLGAVTNLLYALADRKATIFTAVAISSFVGMAFPTISAIKSNNVVRASVQVQLGRPRLFPAKSQCVAVVTISAFSSRTHQSKAAFKGRCTRCQRSPWHSVLLRCDLSITTLKMVRFWDQGQCLFWLQVSTWWPLVAPVHYR